MLHRALLLVFLLLAGGCWSLWHRQVGTPVSVDEIVLLVPDKTDFSDLMVSLWLDAGSEEGLHVVAMHDSDFLRASMGRARFRGVILPDTVHRCASDVLVGGISRYVEQGGALLLVGDAGVLDQNNVYPRASSRFSGLAGVEYAFYDELRDKAISSAEVWVNQRVLGELGIPPGAAIPKSDLPSDSGGAEGPDSKFARYGEEALVYPVFVTHGTYDGRVLLRAPAGVAAGSHKVGNGSVLYVNLPLGYLKGQTDGLLLHAFLRYFAKEMLQLPCLMAVPDGIGGMILNWHLDSNAALAPLAELRKAGVFEQGPYSIHLTAGPDAREFGDGLGLNVDGDPAIQEWIRYFSHQGHAIGSHGGWIHDYFGLHVSENNQKEFEKFLVLNRKTLERVAGGPVREYSAPVGTQPQWVTAWLQQHEILAYYFTGNAGMAPTQTYRNGKKADVEGWSFPISHLGRVASFEEMSKDKISDTQVLQWLNDLSDFCAERHTARLFYSHPPGVIPYLGVIQKWMEKTAALSRDNKLRWYTMAQLADFLNRRRKVKWQLDRGAADREYLLAQDPKGLAEMAWMLPDSIYGRPKVLEGDVAVQQLSHDWLIVAQAGTTLRVELPLLNANSSAGIGERMP